jgi:transcriptional/translational regulatory protein YebC/TACO1
MDLEEMELELIDTGLEELDENEGTLYVNGDYTSFGSLQEALEGMGIEVKKASLQRIPNNPQSFTEEQMEEVEKLIDKLEEDDDVQAVYTNIE